MSYGIPFCLILVARRAATTARALVTIVATLALVSLVLAFQRGGWVVGPIVLALVAVMTLTGPVDSAARARLALRRAGVVVLAMLTLALLIGFTVRTLIPPVSVQDRDPHALGTRFAITDYLGRIQGADVFGDRETYWPVAWQLWQLHPVIGGGVEGFAHLYASEVEAPDGRFHGTLEPVPLGASAHNIYLQAAVGRGLLGLLSLLAMFGLGLRAMVRTATADNTPESQRMLSLAAGGSLLAIMIYGLVQEVTYIHALRLMLCCAVGLLAGGESALKREV